MLARAQAFRIQQPVWAKYLQLRLVSHHGSEPVCALNDVRVHGKSAVEDLEDRLAAPDADEEEEPVLAPPLQEPDQDGGATTQPPPAEAQPEPSHEEAAVGAGGGSPEHPEVGNGSGGVDSRLEVIKQDAAVQPGALLEVPHGLQGLETLPGGQEGQAAGGDAAGEGGKTGVTAHAHEEEEEQQGQPGAERPKGGALPPVLEALGSGLKRLILPPGAGRKRASYAGAPTDASHIAPPATDAGMEKALLMPSPLPLCEALGDGVPDQPCIPAVVGVASEEVAMPCQGSECGAAALPAGNATVAAVAAEAAAVAVQQAVGQGGLVGTWGVVAEGQAGGSRQAAAERERVSLELAANSASSAKARHGGSVYDMLVAEIKARGLPLLTCPPPVARVLGDHPSQCMAICTDGSPCWSRIAFLVIFNWYFISGNHRSSR